MKCPRCGNNDGARIQGFQITDVYDGVLFWRCQECGEAFARDDFRNPRLSARSAEYADELNQARAEAAAAAQLPFSALGDDEPLPDTLHRDARPLPRSRLPGDGV